METGRIEFENTFLEHMGEILNQMTMFKYSKVDFSS